MSFDKNKYICSCNSLIYTYFMYIALDIISNNSLFYNNLCVNIRIWDFYVQFVLSRVILCYYLFVYSVYKTCFKSGPHGRPPIGEWATLYKYYK